jgi:asparagine synthase (glutamine-hydrolysing)
MAGGKTFKLKKYKLKNMCGIAGIISLNGEKVKNLEDKVRKMMRELHHRGPDQEGIYVNEKKTFGLSNNRLAIVAPNENIKLPFTKDDDNFLSFNGEIYNHISLKKYLENKGIQFETLSDTEVLYEYLQQNKKNNLDKLNGVWALAHYNQKKHELFLSRDLLGENNIFYLVENNQLIFASEVKAILKASENIHEIDFESMKISWKFNACSPGKTLIKNIFKLKPGTNLNVLNGKIKIENFQKFELEKWLEYFKKSPTKDEVTKKFEEIFLKEVKLRLPRDIDFFTALSGGIDSTTLVYFISRIKKMFNTVIGVSDFWQTDKIDGYSEVELSKITSEKLNTKHDVVNLRTSVNNANDFLYFAENAFDGCVDPCLINYSRLAKHIKGEKNKVILMSEGVDEVLSGYISDIELNKIDKLLSNKIFLRFSKIILKNYLTKKLVILFLRLKKNKNLEYEYDPLHTRANHNVCGNSFLQKIIKGYDIEKKHSFQKVDTIYDYIFNTLETCQQRALIAATKSIPDMYNLRSDKAFMLNSIETRQPYQAKEIMEFFIAMPNKFRYRNDQGKFFLRDYVSNKISKILGKRSKIGMGSYLVSDKRINETIKATNFFEKFPFKDNIKKILLDKNTHITNTWTVYSFIKTYENLQKLNKDKILKN